MALLGCSTNGRRNCTPKKMITFQTGCMENVWLALHRLIVTALQQAVNYTYGGGGTQGITESPSEAGDLPSMNSEPPMRRE